MNFVDIVFASLLANHLLFFHFLGLGEFLGEGSRLSVVRRTAILTVLLVVASAAYWVPDHFLLQPFHLEFLRSFLVLVLLWLISLAWGAIQSSLPGPQVPVKTFLVHSFLVGGILLVGSSSPDLAEVLTAAVAVSLGYGGALVLLSAIFQRLSRETLPSFIHGLPLQLLTLGVVWLVLQGLGFAFAGKAL